VRFVVPFNLHIISRLLINDGDIVSVVALPFVLELE
jgi:hypothetical protein